VERTKLNPKITKKDSKENRSDDYISVIKLASKGYKESAEKSLNGEDRRAIEILTEKKTKKKGWALLCC